VSWSPLDRFYWIRNLGFHHFLTNLENNVTRWKLHPVKRCLFCNVALSNWKKKKRARWKMQGQGTESRSLYKTQEWKTWSLSGKREVPFAFAKIWTFLPKMRSRNFGSLNCNKNQFSISAWNAFLDKKTKIKHFVRKKTSKSQRVLPWFSFKASIFLFFFYYWVTGRYFSKPLKKVIMWCHTWISVRHNKLALHYIALYCV